MAETAELRATWSNALELSPQMVIRDTEHNFKQGRGEIWFDLQGDIFFHISMKTVEGQEWKWEKVTCVVLSWWQIWTVWIRMMRKKWKENRFNINLSWNWQDLLIIWKFTWGIRRNYEWFLKFSWWDTKDSKEKICIEARKTKLSEACYI